MDFDEIECSFITDLYPTDINVLYPLLLLYAVTQQFNMLLSLKESAVIEQCFWSVSQTCYLTAGFQDFDYSVILQGFSWDVDLC